MKPRSFSPSGLSLAGVSDNNPSSLPSDGGSSDDGVGASSDGISEGNPSTAESDASGWALSFAAIRMGAVSRAEDGLADHAAGVTTIDSTTAASRETRGRNPGFFMRTPEFTASRFRRASPGGAPRS